MRRVFAVIGFSFFFCSIIAVSFNVGISQILLLIALLLLIIAIVIPNLRKNTSVLTVLITVIIALSSFLCRYYFDYCNAVKYSGNKAEIVAYNTDYPDATSSGYMYTFDVKSVDNKDVRFKLKLFSRESAILKPDEQIKTNLKLTTDYCNKLTDYGDGVYLSAYLNDSSSIEATGKSRISLYGIFAEISHFIKEKMTYYMGVEASSLMRSVMFSDKSLLDNDVKADFSACGMQHTMAVSGLHLAIIIGTLNSLLRLIIKRKRAVSVICIVFTLLFMLLVGMRISAVRAGIMLIFVYGGNIFGRKSDGVNSLGIAVTALLIINPYNAVNISFLLSVGATLSMIIIYQPIDKYLRLKLNFKYADIALSVVAPFLQSLVVSIALMPIVVIMFGRVSIIAPLANLILVPLISFALVLSVVFSLVCYIGIFASSLGFVISIIAKMILCVSSALADLPITVVVLDAKSTALSFLMIMILTAASYLLITFNHNKKLVIRLTALLSAIITFASAIVNYYFTKNDVSLSILDSGNGVSVMINENGYVSALGLGGSNIMYAIDSYEQRIRVNRYDTVILPNGSNRYSQNAVNVVKYIKPKTIVMDNDDNKYYAVKSVVADSEILPCNNAEINFGKSKISSLECDDGVAVFIEIGDFSALLIDTKTDVFSIPRDKRKVDIIIVGGVLPKNSDAVESDVVIYATNKHKVDSFKDAKIYNSSDNSCLTVRITENGYSLHNL